MNKIEKGSNVHGLKNEELIVEALNNKKIKQLQGSLAKFIKEVCMENNINLCQETVIYSTLEKNNKLKQDLYITIDNKKFGISVKMGQSNSVHQEKIEGFIKWLEEEIKDNISQEIKDNLRFFIWADGSLDGKAPIVLEGGKVKDRFGSTTFKKLYPDKRRILQEFFDQNALIILDRAIFKGKNNSVVDYIYHGTPTNGVWLSRQEVLEFNMKNSKSKEEKSTAVLSVGRLTIQPWNPDLNGKNAKKRGEIQFKYSALIKDFEKLMLMKSNNIGTYEGDQEEFNLSRAMNINKQHKFWNIISEKCSLNASRDNYFVVKVEGNKYSNLCDKRVKCKTDDYIIEANIDKSFLLQCEYKITESMLKEIGDYRVIAHSGISVKKADSKRYTIIKLTHNSFKQAFKKYIGEVDFIIAGLLLYSEKGKTDLNKKILCDIGIKESKMKQFYLSKFNIMEGNIDNSEYIGIVSKKAKEYVKEIIDCNVDLREKLFAGKGWFADPYYINFIFKGGVLTADIYTDYSISNGSGRSKGNYSIILKPQ